MHISAIDSAVLAGAVARGLAFGAAQGRGFDAAVTACHDDDTCTVIARDDHDTGNAHPPSGWPEHFSWTHSGPGWSKAR